MLNLHCHNLTEFLRKVVSMVFDTGQAVKKCTKEYQISVGSMKRKRGFFFIMPSANPYNNAKNTVD